MSVEAYKSRFGSTYGIDTVTNRLIARDGFSSGGNGVSKLDIPDAKRAGFFEDFINVSDTGANLAARGWEKTAGDTGVNHSSPSGTPGGSVRVTMGATPAAASAANGGGISGRRQWMINQGPDQVDNILRFHARFKATNFNDTGRRLSAFVGLTDTSGPEMPIYDTGGAAIVSTASNAVGFVIGSRADTGISGMSVSGDSDRTPVSLDTGFAPGEWVDLDMEIKRSGGDTGATVTFWVNGRRSGSIAAPANNVKLAPVIYGWPEDTGGGMNIEVDALAVSAYRDSGS